MRTTFGVALIGLLGAIGRADAHGIAGNRFFPGTMTFDDPAVADEFLVVPASRKHSLDDSSGVNVLDTSASWSFMRLLTPEIAAGVGSGWIHRGSAGFPAQAGFDQTSLEIKKLMYRNDLHEVLVSASLNWAIGNSGAQGVGAHAPDLIQPGLFVGKGFGDLPDSLAWFRPFAIAAAITADVPTRATATNFGFDSATGAFGPQVGAAVDTLHWGFSIEYSTLYLTYRFKPGVLPKEEQLHQLIPLV